MTSGTEHINVSGAAELLRELDDILIVLHRDPDGDTVGCGFALWAGLSQIGKKVRVACADDIPLLYGYLTDKYEETYEGDDAFSYKHVVTVDAASPEQLGRLMDLCDSVVLSIDHHASNTGYASKTLLDEDSASCAEIVYYLLLELSVKIDGYIAAALYTGVSTDTGCFRFRNTTMDSHRVAAELIGCGIDLAFLNRVLFETRSRGLISLQCQVMGSLEYYGDGKIAAVTITKEMMSSSGAKEEDMSSISPIPRSIEGVEVGITFRELENGLVKCSVRTTKLIDASKICMLFGGGGHHGAAGFMCTGEMDDIKTAVIRAVIVELGETKA